MKISLTSHIKTKVNKQETFKQTFKKEVKQIKQLPNYEQSIAFSGVFSKQTDFSDSKIKEIYLEPLAKAVELDDDKNALKIIKKFSKISNETNKNKIPTLQYNYKGGVFNTIIENKNPKVAKEFLGFVKTLNNDTQNQFALSTNENGESLFSQSLDYYEHEIANDFLEFVKSTEGKTQDKFILITTNSGETQLERELINNEKDALKFLDFVKTRNPETKKEFALLNDQDGENQFEFALWMNKPDISCKFLIFALDAAPKEFLKWEIPKEAAKVKTFEAVALKVACSKEFSKEESLKWLNKNNCKGSLDSIIRSLESYQEQ